MMDNLSVTVKLVILNVAAIIGIVILGFVGYSAVESAHGDMEIMYNRYLHSVHYVGKCRHSLRFVQGLATMLPGTTKQSLIESRTKKCNTAMDEFDENLALYEKLIAQDANLVAELKPIKEDWAKIRSSVAKLTTLRISP